MDKYQAYPGALALDTNFLNPQRATEIALGFMMRAAFGTSTLIDGFAVAPTSVPSMTVTVGQGSIIVSTTVDTLTSGFASLPVDNTNPLVKIGINLTPTTMPLLTPPAVAGQSQNWLIECQFVEQDTAPVVLPYYDKDTPGVPFTGPEDAGTPNVTARTNTVALQWKSAAAAATGQQATPTPDAAWTGIAIVTLTNGQSTITAPNITPYGGAPFVPTKLGAQRIQLTGPLDLYVSPFGSDTSNTGLAPSSPFATWQAAWNLLSNRYDLNGWNVQINIANGTYTQPLSCVGLLTGQGVGNIVTFVGNPASPSSVNLAVTNAYAITAQNGANVHVSGFTVSAQGSIAGPQFTIQPSCFILGGSGGLTITGPIVFGPATHYHMYVSAGATVSCTSQNYTISGSATAHLVADAAGTINITGNGSTVITLIGNPNFSHSFAWDQRGATIQVLNISFSGTATGKRYDAQLNATISVAGLGPNFLPGTIAGTTGLGGQYL